MPFNRRDFMVGAGLMAGGLVMAKTGRDVLGARGAQAAPEAKIAQVPGLYRTKVGAFEVTAVLDGPMTMDQSVFNQADDTMFQGVKNENFLKASEPLPAFISCFLIKKDGKYTLVDTGGQGMIPGLGRTVEAFKVLGITPDDIGTVLLTHLHPDHANGLLDEDGQRRFRKAVVRVSDPELKFWSDDAQKAKYAAKAMMFDIARKNIEPYKQKGQVEAFSPHADLGGGISSVFLPGHTPGHSGFRISDGADQLLIWGDIVHSQFVQFAHPEQTVSYDLDPDMARATRLKIMDEVATDRIRIGGMHIATPSIGHVAKRGNGYEYVSQYWEANL